VSRRLNATRRLGIESPEAEQIPAEDVRPNNTCTKQISSTPQYKYIPPVQYTCSHNTIIHPDQYKYTVHYKYRTNTNTCPEILYKIAVMQ